MESLHEGGGGGSEVIFKEDEQRPGSPIPPIPITTWHGSHNQGMGGEIREN